MKKLLVRIVHAGKEDWYFNLFNSDIEVYETEIIINGKRGNYYIPFEDEFENKRRLIPKENCQLIGTVVNVPVVSDAIRPSHYGGEANPFEAIKIIDHYNLSFYPGNVIKYVLRAGKKDPNKEIEDLKKAAFYLNRHIEVLSKKKNG